MLLASAIMVVRLHLLRVSHNGGSESSESRATEEDVGDGSGEEGEQERFGRG